jgi:hypothetical protein
MILKRLSKYLPAIVALLPFGALWAVFFSPLLTLDTSFILSDYMAQHVPWARTTFDAVRSGTLPFWTPLMGGGFPLFAEGQAAAIYLPQWAAYRMLPFLAAYTWSVPLHFAIGGIGMFVYARRAGLGRYGAGLAAACFAFGSGYAGCFLNTASLRVACWIPLALWLLDSARQAGAAKRLLLLLALALIVSQQWTAGASQMAVYTFGYYIAHELIAAFQKSGRSAGPAGVFGLMGLGAALVLGASMALMQIAPSMELIGHSVRQGEGASFALWGSVPPIAPFLLFYPEWGNALRYCFYIGTAPLLFVLLLPVLDRPRPALRHLILAALFFALAIGRFNPIYAWAVEHFHLTLLRNPAKFLFFTATSLSVLAGCGLDAVLAASADRGGSARSGRAGWWAAAIGVAAAVMPAAGQLTLALARPFWSEYRSWYVDRLIAEKGTLAKVPEYYFGLMDRFFEGLGTLFSYRNMLNLRTVAFAAAAALIIWLFLRSRIKRSAFLIGTSVVLVLDLYLFAHSLGTGFLGNVGPITKLEPSGWTQAVIAQTFKEPGRQADPPRVAELASLPPDYQLTPNYQMYFGLAHAGGYSPLLLKRYHELVYDLGISDGSLGMPPVSIDVWKRQGGIVDLIGARYLSTDILVEGTEWTLLQTSREQHFGGAESGAPVGEEDRPGRVFERRLYRNDAATPLLWPVSSWEVIPDAIARLERLKKPDFNPHRTAVLEMDPRGSPVLNGPSAELLALRATSSGVGWEAEVSGHGLWVTRISNYPGWQLQIDGSEGEILSINHAFMGFWTGPGVHKIRLTYVPNRWNQWRMLTLAGWAAWTAATALGLLSYARDRARRKTVLV